MDNRSKIVLVAGIAITLLLLLVNIYIAGIVFVLAITIFMSLLIMQDSVSRPDVSASLAEDARSIILKNSGNAKAVHIHVALVPLNTEYDVKSLAVDETHSYPLVSMVQEVKVAVTFENEDHGAFSGTYPLSSLGNAYEPFKPIIPMFKYK
jgi:hypothetical protein